MTLRKMIFISIVSVFKLSVPLITAEDMASFRPPTLSLRTTRISPLPL